MFPKTNPTTTNAWQQLQDHFNEMRNAKMTDLFAADHSRFDEFSVQFRDLLFDYSKNRIDRQTMKLLLNLAKECGLEQAKEAMFTGEKINETENRAVLHYALRQSADTRLSVDGEDIMQEVNAGREAMLRFCDAIHSGSHAGYSGKKIKYVVNIGIGGSDLGPAMVTEALRPYRKRGIESFFVSNVDPSHLAGVLDSVKADRTLFIIASKTFTTQETMSNARIARQWFLDNGGSEAAIANHFAAVSTNIREASAFGINPSMVFGFRDWVGGRYSVWSSIGLSVALSVGRKNYEKFLSGAAEADAHFRKSKNEKNIPVIMALLGIWYRNFFGFSSCSVNPYDQHLQRFPAYLQQADMESNGKSVDRSGSRINYATSPVIWGEPGTNGQHAFFQMLHQGTDIIPCDFIASANAHYPLGDSHAKLLSNFFAQAEALMNGASGPDAYRIFEGNRPSNSFLFKKMTPAALGKLIALYEHKIFVQGVIWNIYSFDQWGVELGKKLAGNILPELQGDANVSTHDASTNGLINAFQKMRKA